MVVLYLVLIGFLVFVLGVGILGVWLRGNPSKENAEKSSRISQFLFFAGLVTPAFIALFTPGLTNIDSLLSVASLPYKPFFLIAGILLAIPGLYLLVISNQKLRALGSGANAFRLTKRIVGKDIYGYTRNPMSLGYYIFSLSVSFITGSTLLTLGVLLGLIPAHVFYIKYFEELELELRFGESYIEYKQEVPFLIPKLPSN